MARVLFSSKAAAGGVIRLTATPEIYPNPPQAGKNLNVLVKFEASKSRLVCSEPGHFSKDSYRSSLYNGLVRYIFACDAITLSHNSPKS